MNLAISNVVVTSLLLSQTRRSMSKRPITSFFSSVKKPRVAATATSVSSSPPKEDGNAAGTSSLPRDEEGPGSRSVGATHSKSNKKAAYTVFCDLDGVLADFDAGVRTLLGGQSPDQVPSQRLWPAIHNAAHFFRDLPWTSDGEELWDALRGAPCRVNILTGVSARGGVVHDKFLWCQRELCVETNLVDMTGPPGARKHEPAQPHAKRRSGNAAVVNVIACWSKNKHFESKPGHILIDDREKLRGDWEKAGGTFVLHTTTSSTLKELRDLGIVDPRRENEEGEKPHQTNKSPLRGDRERSSSKAVEAT